MLHQFPAELQVFIAKQLADNQSLQDIYKTITAETFKPRYTGSYSQYTRQVHRKITPDQIEQHRSVSDFASIESQIGFISKMLNDAVGSTTDKLRAIELLARLYDRLDAKTPPQKIGTPYLPTEIELTSSLLVDLISVNEWQSEIAEALITNLPINDRHALLLQFLPDILTLEHRKETWPDKRARLRVELQALTESELRSIESDNEKLGFPIIVEDNDDDK